MTLKNGLKGRYEKGIIPFNKGTKGLMKPNSGSFKKGNKPHNTRNSGDEYLSKDGYVYLKISDNNWILKHHKIWIENYGDIPENHIIRFKDGNKLNFDIDNLYMLDLKTNMIKNSIQRFPKDLRNAIKLLFKLKKKLKDAKEQN